MQAGLSERKRKGEGNKGAGPAREIERERKLGWAKVKERKRRKKKENFLFEQSKKIICKVKLFQTQINFILSVTSRKLELLGLGVYSITITCDGLRRFELASSVLLPS